MTTPESPYGSSAAENVAGGGPVRLPHLLAAKAEGTRLTMITAYDGLTAAIFDEAGMDMILVGDSIGNVMLGHGSTLPVSLDEMVVATRSVCRAARRALVIADLPFGTYEAGPEQALSSAVGLIKAGANAVKLEGGRRARTRSEPSPRPGSPSWGTSASLLSPSTRWAASASRVAARRVRSSWPTPWPSRRPASWPWCWRWCRSRWPHASPRPSPSPPSASARARCDGQVLVWSDMAGMTEWRPRFAKRFGRVGEALRRAARDYAAEVREGAFPAEEHWFDS